MCGVLLFAGARVFDDPGEGEFGVFWSLREAAREVVQSTSHPRIKFAKAVHAERDQAFGKKFGERRGHGFEMGARGDEMDISVHRVTRGGKYAVTAYSLNAGQAGGFDKLQPFFDSAGSTALAVVDD